MALAQNTEKSTNFPLHFSELAMNKKAPDKVTKGKEAAEDISSHSLRHNRLANFWVIFPRLSISVLLHRYRHNIIQDL